MKRKNTLYILCYCILCSFNACETKENHTYLNGIYYWNPNARTVAREGFSQHLYLCAETYISNQTLYLKKYEISQTFDNLLPVVRLNADWYTMDAQQRQQLSYEISDMILSFRSKNMQVHEIQFDYDVQKGSLPVYQTLIQQVLQRVPDLKIECTLLASRMKNEEEWIPVNANSTCVMMYDVLADNATTEEEFEFLSKLISDLKLLQKPVSIALPCYSMITYSEDNLVRWSMEEPESLQIHLLNDCFPAGNGNFEVNETFLLDGKWYKRFGNIGTKRNDYAHLLALWNLIQQNPPKKLKSIFIFSDNAYSRNVLPYGIPDSLWKLLK